jgi:ribosomal protein L7/L12
MAIACPTCRVPLPVLAGVDEYALLEVAELMASSKIDAIKRVRELSGCGLREAKEYVECPHRTVLPVVAAPAPPVPAGDVACPACGRPLPPLARMTPSHLRTVANFLGKQRKIEAIKEVRARTGWGLKEAKDYVDCPHSVAYDERAPISSEPTDPAAPATCTICFKPFPPIPAGADTLAQVAAFVKAHQPINAIKILREATGWGLKESKDYVQCPHVVP